MCGKHFSRHFSRLVLLSPPPVNATTDFNQWPAVSRTILVLLTFCGACAGSTGGGIKISRLLLLAKSVRKELHLYLHPNAVKKIKMDGKAVSHEVMRATNIYMIVYLMLMAVSIFLISFDEFDLVTNFTAVATTLNNVGPGLSLIGPTGNFGIFSPLSKLVLSFDMLAGRLELFPILILFLRETWKKILIKNITGETWVFPFLRFLFPAALDRTFADLFHFLLISISLQAYFVIFAS